MGKSMNKNIKHELFTKSLLYGKLYHYCVFYGNLPYKRYILAIKTNPDSIILVQVLNDFFPGLVFVPKNNNETAVAKYIVQNNGNWTLDLKAMSKSSEKIYSSLFPDNISSWNEAEARIRYGRADVIRFFINAENALFSAGFFSSGNEAGQSIPCRFFDELDFNGKSVWQDWDFSSIVIHRLRRRPPSIYEAFGYYARRFYNLINFGLTSGQGSDDELIKTGVKALNAFLKENVPETANFNIDRLTGFFEIVQETLESIPAGATMYIPVTMNILLNQLKTKMLNLYKKTNDWKSTDWKEEETYSAADRKTINNHLDKALRNAAEMETIDEIRKQKLSGTYREKIIFLHSFVLSEVRKEYSQRERNIIHGLFLKQYRAVSLDKPQGAGGYDDDEYTVYDFVKDDKFTSPEDYLTWSSFFRDEFVNELDKDNLEKFLECLPDHFSRYPFDVDTNGNLSISKYSRKMLFSLFCQTAGILNDNEIWKPFLVLLQRVVDNINNNVR